MVKPATPGFVVTLIATILLALVSFNVPVIKSISFLEASLTVDNVNGTISLGTLGYCIELSSNGTTCSSPSVGYKFDPNALLGDSISFAQIPTVVVKWITYALFLHVIALGASAISAFFGLLAHVREMSMTYCSTCISGFAAFIALVAFIFDIVLFFIVKARVKSIDGTASFGAAIWMTLAAWVLLFFSGCAFACGRCCIQRRPRGAGGEDGRMDNGWMSKFGGGQGSGNDYHAEQMRLDAVKAEADRKARQKNEIGLPAFPEHVPLNGNGKAQYLEEESDDEHHNPYRDEAAIGTATALGAGAGVAASGPRRQASGPAYRGGYAQGAPGTRAVDEYYNSSTTPSRSNTANTGYPPPPNRNYNGTPSQANSAYAQSMYSTTSGTQSAASAPHMPTANTTTAAAIGTAAGAGYLAAQGYGHKNGGSSYHTAASSQHQQYPSAYSQYNDPYSQPQHQQQSSFNAETYNNTAALPGSLAAGGAAAAAYRATSPPRRQGSTPYDAYGNTGYTAAGTSGQQAAYSSAYNQPSGYNDNNNQYNNNNNAGSSNYYGYGYDAYGAGGSQQQYQQHQQHQQHQQQDRSYSLGGGGYGANVVPDTSTVAGASAYGVTGVALTNSPPPMPTVDTSTSKVGVLNSGGVMSSPVKGPRSPTKGGYGYAQQGAVGVGVGVGAGAPQQQEHSSSQSSYEDSPPQYDATAGPSVTVPEWGSKGGLTDVSR